MTSGQPAAKSPYTDPEVAVGPRSHRARGRRVFSVNTWLIAINVAVFLLNNIVFQSVQYKLPAGTHVFPGVSHEQIGSGVVGRSTIVSDGIYYGHPIFDASATALDAAGRAKPLQIGVERYRVLPVLDAFGHFSTGKFWSDGQIWRLLTFQFLHANLWHLLFNMLGLYIFGDLVEQYLGRRRYAVFYLTSGVFGALAYLLLNLLGYFAHRVGLGSDIPFLIFNDPYTTLVGASAGVFGVLLAAAYIAPREIVYVLGLVPLPLKIAVYLFLALAVLNLYTAGHNAGGDAAHVGGALAGAYLIRRPHVLRDLAFGFGLFAPFSRDRRRDTGGSAVPIDAVLHKARKHGAQSLSSPEKAALRRFLESGTGRDSIVARPGQP